MRMGPDAARTAAEIVNTWGSADLAALIRRYGEGPLAARIADAIVSARPIESTGQLSTVIAEAMPAARRRAGHPARRVFQALRIAVNDELDAVAAGLDQAISMIRGGGRVVAISYHSLEDRIVKRRFNAGATGCVCPPQLPVCGCGRAAELRVLTRKPLRAGVDEVSRNRRARSALLRAAEKVAA
jgi:16S rRNA (cytosine1402-N4)-methyltransferase